MGEKGERHEDDQDIYSNQLEKLGGDRKCSILGGMLKRNPKYSLKQWRHNCMDMSRKHNGMT